MPKEETKAKPCPICGSDAWHPDKQCPDKVTCPKSGCPMDRNWLDEDLWNALPRHKKQDFDKDYLFLTEIMNDLHKNGFQYQGKAETMLRDWKKELRRDITFSKTNQKKVFSKEIGLEQW